MPRHRTRQNATHRLTATREGYDGEDAYGSPTSSGPTDVIGGTSSVDPLLVDYSSGGTSYIRESAGERVREAPTVSGAPELARHLEEGDTVDLEALDPNAPDLGPFEVRGVDADYPRGGARVGQATVELEHI